MELHHVVRVGIKGMLNSVKSFNQRTGMNNAFSSELISAFAELIVQVDEDCPSEYRTKHLRDAMLTAIKLLNEID